MLNLGGIATPTPLSPEELRLMDAWCRAANYLSVGQIYLYDNPLLTRPLTLEDIGDGEAETGALATSWHSNKFLNTVRDGAVLPILHLNGYQPEIRNWRWPY